MEREILFRGKAINRDSGYYRTTYKNGDWVYGLLTQPYNERYDLPAEMTNTSGVSGIEVDYETIGQYTGLTDKNGVKIFEGDIMSLVTEFGDTIIREIRFIDGAFCVIGEQEDDLHGLSWAVEMCDGIVGDNIHDNPDLLK